MGSKNFHPFLFGIFPIISLFASNIQQLYITEILLPLILVIGFTGILWFIIRIVLKDAVKSAFIVSLFLVVFFSYGYLTDEHGFYLVLFLIILSIGTFFLVKTKKLTKGITTIINFISLVLVVIVSADIGLYYLENSQAFSAETDEIDFKQIKT